MARKKYIDENNENGENQSQAVGILGKGPDLHSHHLHEFHGGVKPFQNHHFRGGGTKTTEYRHENSKNTEEDGVGKQLSALGLTIREMPGDGNCLFRALSDQITGSSRSHLEYRRAVAQYMKEFRADFEPFIEDEVPFSEYIQRLSQPGTFGGNDAIVAFSRLHNVSVVIHQLNSPAWVIHPSKDSQPSVHTREVHIFYHNGDHYNSVRRIGDDSESPTSIRLHTEASSTKPNLNKGNGKKSSPPHTTTSANATSSDGYSDQMMKRDEDYWVKDSSDVDRLVKEVMNQTNYFDETLIRETLIDYNFDMVATIHFIITISMSVMINQQTLDSDNLVRSDTADTQEASAESGLPSTETGSDFKPDEMGANTIQIENSVSSAESEEGKSNSESPTSSQSLTSGAAAEKERKRSNRHKKEMRRRERKRDADRRKIPMSGVEKENNTVIISHLGSLDI